MPELTALSKLTNLQTELGNWHEVSKYTSSEMFVSASVNLLDQIMFNLESWEVKQFEAQRIIVTD